MKNPMKFFAAFAIAALAFDVDGAFLPSGYTRLEYIESDFGCGPKEYPYIDTGYCPTNTTIIDCEVEISTNQRDKWAAPFGMCAAPDTLSRELETKFYKTRGVYPDFREQIKTDAGKKISKNK